MSFYTAERLYELLPAFYRIRDIELARQARTPAQQQEIDALRSQLEAAAAADSSGPDAVRLKRRLDRVSAGPLRALIEVLAEQIAVLEEDLEQLEDDQFIETCAEWVVPYIGELVGARGLREIPGDKWSRRAQVANTLAYRRRKGTAAILEQVARDVTGQDASVVEYFQRLVATQYMNHIRPEAEATVDLRGFDAREPLDGPFGQAARTVEVRRIASSRGKFNIPNIGIHLWRVRSFAWTDVPAFRHDDRRFSFHPLGLDIPLFNRPETEEAITHLATPDNVAHPLRRRDVRERVAVFYGRNNSFAVSADGQETPRSAISICDLSEWTNAPPGRTGIDVELGRIVFPEDQPADADIRTVLRYGFGAPIGGGEYGRSTTLGIELSPVATVQGGNAADLQQSLDSVANGGAVEIRDSGVYAGALAIEINAGASVEIRSADLRFAVLRLSADLEVFGGTDSSVTMNGILFDGGAIRVPATLGDGSPNALRRLRIEHCTVRPGSPQVSLIVELPEVSVEIDHSIMGALRVIETAEVSVADSILDSGDPASVCYSAPDGSSAGAPMQVRNSTLVGKVFTRVMNLASNTIFLARVAEGDQWTAPVRAERLQEGCVRYSYVPLDARVPRRHRCRPENAAESMRVRPVFHSLRYSHPAYAMLHPATPAEIRTGADDQGEMGAFHDLYQPQRESALRASLREHLRFGLEAGIFYGS